MKNNSITFRLGEVLVIGILIFQIFTIPKIAYGAKNFDVDTGGTLTTNLVSWYNLESSSIDEFGSNAGSDTQSLVYASNYGKIENGVLTGSNGKILAGGFGTRTNNSPLSFGGWIYFSSLPGVEKRLLSLPTPDPSGTGAYSGVLDGYISITSDNRAKFALQRQNQATDLAQSPANAVTTGWHHWLAIFNGSNLYIYLDGSQVGSAGKSAINTATDNTYGLFGIAANEYTMSENLTAQFDLIGYWSKALSSTEISDLYNSGNGNAYREFSPTMSAITGYGTTTNRLAKFTSSTVIADSLLSDDGVDVTLTSGNFFLQAGRALDVVVSGILNIGTSIANAINIGRAGITTTIHGLLSWTKMATVSNCNSASSPSNCGSAPAGSVALPVGTATLLVSSTAVTADSQILITEDFSLGGRLGVTCNTVDNRTYRISARVSGVSFTIGSDRSPTTNPACLSYLIVN